MRGRPETLTMQTQVGEGRPCLERVGRALQSGALHRLAGIAVPDGGFATGQRIRPRAKVGPVPVVAPVEVTAMEHSDDGWSLAYRALPGHPEVGTEVFSVCLGPEGRVVFGIDVESRPGPWWVRAVAPVARVVQHDFTVRYLLAARRLGRA